MGPGVVPNSIFSEIAPSPGKMQASIAKDLQSQKSFHPRLTLALVDNVTWIL